MNPRTLEEVFARFRGDHDLAALAEVFDRTAPELLELARHLTRGRGEAEDLVQATFLTAIEGAQRFEEGRELVPWLLGILAHLARRARERRGAVGEPSPELADPRAADPAARAAEREFRAALEGALGRLPAAYREVVASHLGEGHAPEEIARRLGRAPGTVRVQLHRGFRHLRRLLPAGFALGALGLLSPRGLASVRKEVLRAAGRSAAVPASTAASMTLGGMLMAKKVTLVTAVIVAVAACWWVARAQRRPEAPVSMAYVEPGAVLAVPSAEVLAPARDVPRREPLPEPRASIATSDEPYGALALELTWWDGTPAQEVELRLVPWGERQPEQAFQLALTDEQGDAQVARIHEGVVWIEIGILGLSGDFKTEVRRGETRAERITLPRGIDVVGRVLDARGAPAAGASIWVSQELMEPAFLAARAGPDGTFRARSLYEYEGNIVLATADGGGSSEAASWAKLEPVDENTRRVELRLRGECAALAGRVTDATGAPVGGALITLFGGNDRAGHELRHWPQLRVSGGGDGSFLVGGLHRGGVDVRVAAPGFALWRKNQRLEEDRTTSIDVVLDEGFSVRGSVALPDGSAVPGARVHVQPVDYRDPELWTLADGEGRYLLDRVPAGEVVLVVSEGSDEHGRQTQKRMTGRVGDALAWDAVFGAGPVIRGTARDEAGRSLAGWRVRAWPVSGTGAANSAEIRTDEQGGFLIPDLADTPYDVVLYAPDAEAQQPRARVERVLAGGAPLELVARAEPSAFVSGRVLDPEGAPVHPNLSAYRVDGFDSAVATEWSEGERFRLGPMLAGAYRLSLSVAGLPGYSIDLLLGEGEERDLGDIALPRPGRVRLTLRDRDGQPIAGRMSAFLQDARLFVSPLESTDGLVYESDPLFPGAYELRVMYGSVAPDRRVSIEVRSGETTSVELNLAPARNVALELLVPDGEPLPRNARCEFRDAAGVILTETAAGGWHSQGTPDRVGISCALPLGRYRYSIRSLDGWSAAGELEVVPSEDPFQRGTIALSR